MGLIVDNFAGGGGASTGIEMALGRQVDIAINHDPEALAMHEANHPATRHYVEDVWQVDPLEVTRGELVDLAWFSPDCTHFSKAKGGKPRDKKIRGLAWVAVRWAQQVRPNVICLENVEEFRDWGPLSDEGQPIRAQRGQIFDIFLAALREQGYWVEHRELSACDYGTPTTRKRFFLVARRDGRPIVWPEKTHGPKHRPYRTAGECIDWSIPCPSIFDRSKPLAENTLRRIAKGIVKYVLNTPTPFIVSLNHTADYYRYFRGQGLDAPLATITQVNGNALVVPHIISYYGSKRPEDFRGSGLDTPVATQTTENRHALVAASLVQTGYGERKGQSPRSLDIEQPLGTVVAGGTKHALVEAFLAKHYGGVVGSPLDGPMGTVTGVDHHSLVACHLERQFGNSIGGDLADPMGTVMPGGSGKTGLVAATLIKNNFGDYPHQDVMDPLHTITTQHNKFSLVAAFLAKYYGTNIGAGLDEPLHTLTSQGNKFSLVTVNIGGDPYVIVDIGMRMLHPRELFRAQGFPDSYVIDPVVRGKKLSKSAQVRMVGNSVCPPVAAAVVGSNVGAVLRERAV